MMEIVRRRGYREWTTYQLEYGFNGGSDLCWATDCDEHGNVDERAMRRDRPEAFERWLEIKERGTLRGESVTCRGVVKLRHRETTPAVGICEDCGRRVTLYNAFTITCECGADYNSAGQRLAPRSQWGEETGEPWYECY